MLKHSRTPLFYLLLCFIVAGCNQPNAKPQSGLSLLNEVTPNQMMLVNRTNDGSPPVGDLITDRGQTGDSGIMILQNRRLGDSLWKQVVVPDGSYAVELGTEAAVGTLRLEQGKYQWDEEAD